MMLIAQEAERSSRRGKVVGSSPAKHPMNQVLCLMGLTSEFLMRFPSDVSCKILDSYFGIIAQMTRAPDLHSGGRGFESHWFHFLPIPLVSVLKLSCDVIGNISHFD